MGLPAIAAMMASRGFGTVTFRESRLDAVDEPESRQNKYGDLYREQIIRSVIRRARPWPWFVHLDICPLDKAAKILNVPFRGNDAYRLLAAYHCVGYFSIPAPIRRRIPELIREALTEEGN